MISSWHTGSFWASRGILVLGAVAGGSLEWDFQVDLVDDSSQVWTEPSPGAPKALPPATCSAAVVMEPLAR